MTLANRFFLALVVLSFIPRPSLAVDLNPLHLIEAVVEDRSAGDLATDSRIKGEITVKVIDKMGSDVFPISADVYEQVVMLTGVVPTQKQKDQAGELVRGIEGVKRLYNDIRVIPDVKKEKGSVEGFVDDTVIEGKIKALFIDAEGVNQTNFRWRSVQGWVFLFGRALSQSELNKAVNIVKSVANVQRVTNRAFIRAKK